MSIGSQPFNNSAAAPALVEMWRNNLRKSRAVVPAPAPTLAQTAMVNIVFEGGGQPLFAGLGGLVEIPFPCTVLGCHMFAGTVDPVTFEPVPSIVSATVILRLGTQGAWAGGTRPLYATVPPAMVSVVEEAPVIDGWVTQLQAGDLIAYSLAAFTGAATFLTLSLPIRRIDTTGLGTEALTDATGDAYVDASGQTYTVRT